MSYRKDSRAHNLALQRRRRDNMDRAKAGTMTRDDFWKLDQSDRESLRYDREQELSRDQSQGFAGAGRAGARQKEMDRWMGQWGSAPQAVTPAGPTAPAGQQGGPTTTGTQTTGTPGVAAPFGSPAPVQPATTPQQDAAQAGAVRSVYDASAPLGDAMAQSEAVGPVTGLGDETSRLAQASRAFGPSNNEIRQSQRGLATEILGESERLGRQAALNLQMPRFTRSPMEAQLEQFLGGQLQRGMYGQDPITQYQLSETQADIERARDQQIEDLQRFGIIGGEGVSMGAGADVLSDFYDRSGRRMDAVRAAGTQRMLDTILPQATQFGGAQAERAHRAREFESGLNLDRLKLQQDVADAALARRKMLTEATGIEQFEEGVRQFERELDVGTKESALDRALTTSESQAQREFAASESLFQREHEKAEAELGRQLTADESERLRTFTKDQSKLDRALRREEAIGEIMTPEGFRRQSLAGRQMAQDESQFARELAQRQQQADRDRDLRQQEVLGYRMGPGGRREETLGARELGQRSAEAELDRALSREEIAQRGEMGAQQRALEREALTGEVVGPGGRRMTTLESQRLADARDQFDRGLISREQLAAQERALEREALTGEVVGPGGQRMATVDRQRLDEARDQFDRGLISQEELARQERQLEREALTGEVMTGGRRMTTVESQRVGLERQRLADARDQFDRGLISQEQLAAQERALEREALTGEVVGPGGRRMTTLESQRLADARDQFDRGLISQEELTRREQDLKRAEITGEIASGPGGEMKATLRAQEMEADRALREAGITGQYGEDETLAAKELRLREESDKAQRELQRAEITGQIRGETGFMQDTVEVQRLRQAQDQFDRGLISQEELASAQRELQRAEITGQIRGETGFMQETMGARQLRQAQDQFDRGLISREELAEAERGLQRDMALGQVRGPTGYMQDTLEAQRLREDQDFREREFDLRRELGTAELTGYMPPGPGGQRQETLAGRQLRESLALDQAGVTGQYQGDPTLRARELEAQRTESQADRDLRQSLGVAGLTGDVGADLTGYGAPTQRTLAAQELASRQEDIDLQRELDLMASKIQIGGIPDENTRWQLERDIRELYDRLGVTRRLPDKKKKLSPEELAALDEQANR